MIEVAYPTKFVEWLFANHPESDRSTIIAALKGVARYLELIPKGVVLGVKSVKIHHYLDNESLYHLVVLTVPGKPSIVCAALGALLVPLRWGDLPSPLPAVEVKAVYKEIKEIINDLPK